MGSSSFVQFSKKSLPPFPYTIRSFQATGPLLSVGYSEKDIQDIHDIRKSTH